MYNDKEQRVDKNLKTEISKKVPHLGQMHHLGQFWPNIMQFWYFKIHSQDFFETMLVHCCTELDTEFLNFGLNQASKQHFVFWYSSDSVTLWKIGIVTSNNDVVLDTNFSLTWRQQLKLFGTNGKLETNLTNGLFLFVSIIWCNLLWNVC